MKHHSGDIKAASPSEKPTKAEEPAEKQRLALTH
jgi:hypothetical protein